MRSLFPVFSLLTLTLIISCSEPGASRPFTGLSQNETMMADGSNIEGIYATDVWPVNTNLNFKKLGEVALERQGDEFKAFVNLQYGSRSTQVKQAIYTGRRCPELKDDLNKDAYIDIQEALIAIGQISIPLDSNLDSQQAGLGEYPVGNPETGAFAYQVTASFQRMFSDLKTADENSEDNIIKLGESDGLTFPGRIVLFQGMNESGFLPPSIATSPGLTPHQSIPIGCGVLWKVEKNPISL